jgi:transposase
MTLLIANILPQGRIPHARRLHLHLDNCRVHFSNIIEQFITQNQILRVPHPSYSPDIASLDFSLFGHVKNSLVGRTFDEPEQLLEAITEFWMKFSPQNWKLFSATGGCEHE